MFGSSVFPVGQKCPIPWAALASPPQIFGASCMRAHSTRNSDLTYYVAGPPLLNGRCTSLLRVVVSEMTYTVSSGTLNSSIPYHTWWSWCEQWSKGKERGGRENGKGGKAFPLRWFYNFIISPLDVRKSTGNADARSICSNESTRQK